MNYTPTQLEAIRIFGKKDLTEGCIVRKEKGKWFKIANISDIKYPNGKICYKQAKGYGVHGKFYQPKFKTELDFEILGHEPHLFPDVARVAEERGWLLDVKWGLLTITFPDRTYTSCKYLTTIPFIEQPEKTLQQIISLFN